LLKNHSTQQLGVIIKSYNGSGQAEQTRENELPVINISKNAENANVVLRKNAERKLHQTEHDDKPCTCDDKVILKSQSVPDLGAKFRSSQQVLESIMKGENYKPKK
jgi:hypothetical protein